MLVKKKLLRFLSYGYYYTRDVIGIKIMHRDLPYYKGIRAKHAMNINFMKISMKIMQTLYILGPSSSYLVILSIDQFAIQWQGSGTPIYPVLQSLSLVKMKV